MGFISIQVYRESLRIGLRSLLRYAVVRRVAGKQDDGACTEVANVAETCAAAGAKA
jgi:hypothetical protein